MHWAALYGYKFYIRHLIMGVLVILLIISNIADEIMIRNWSFTWMERKIAETVFVIIGGIIVVPILYRRFFTHQDNGQNKDDE